MTRPLTILTILAVTACGSRPPPTSPDERPPVDIASSAGTEVHPAPPALPPSAPVPVQAAPDHHAAEMAAYANAKPVFDKFCASCHAQGRPGARQSTLAHLDVTSYPFGGHHADTVGASVRKSLGIDGGKATMPKNKPGSMTSADLALIKEWADAFDAAHAGGAHTSTDTHHGEHNDGHGH